MSALSPDDHAVIESVSRRASPTPPHPHPTALESALVEARSRAESAEKEVALLTSLGKNWMGFTDVHLARLLGTSPTTIARRESARLREDVSAAVHETLRGKP